MPTDLVLVSVGNAMTFDAPLILADRSRTPASTVAVTVTVETPLMTTLRLNIDVTVAAAVIVDALFMVTERSVMAVTVAAAVRVETDAIAAVRCAVTVAVAVTVDALLIAAVRSSAVVTVPSATVSVDTALIATGQVLPETVTAVSTMFEFAPLAFCRMAWISKLPLGTLSRFSCADPVSPVTTMVPDL